jgi:hypothetical protein
MGKDEAESGRPGAKPTGRAERLAVALRANLRRRKAQSRGRDDTKAVDNTRPPAAGRPEPDAER